MIPCREIFPLLFLSISISIPEVISYAKVSKNGQEAVDSEGEPLVGIPSSRGQKSEGRSVQDIVITASPVFVSARNPILRPGEAIDYPTTKGYSTLDEGMVAQLDSLVKHAQERFHPPAPFEHNVAKKNAMKNAMMYQNQPDSGKASSSSSMSRPPMGPDITYTRPVISGTYYEPPNFGSVGSKPSYSGPNYPPLDPGPEEPTSYETDSYLKDPNPKGAASYGSDSYLNNHGPDQDPQDTYGNKPMNGDTPPKSVEYETHFDHPPFPDSYGSNHDYHQEIIYDHIPDDHLHHHHHHHTTTEEPEMDDQRLSKRPYSYYFIGKKLWYVPLYFSIYFIIYISALILKSVARHKINFPATLAAASADARSAGNHENESGWWDYTVWILEAIEKYRKT